MTRKLDIDDLPLCKWRIERCEKALDDLKWAAFELKVAGAMRAHARVAGCRKSVQGALNHARARYNEARRKAEGGTS
jgi:hypothetical protein